MSEAAVIIDEMERELRPVQRLEKRLNRESELALTRRVCLDLAEGIRMKSRSKS